MWFVGKNNTIIDAVKIGRCARRLLLFVRRVPFNGQILWIYFKVFELKISRDAEIDVVDSAIDNLDARIVCRAEQGIERVAFHGNRYIAVDDITVLGAVPFKGEVGRGYLQIFQIKVSRNANVDVLQLAVLNDNAGIPFISE